MIRDIKKYSELIYTVFYQNRNEIDLPFFGSYPRNCCEAASYFLGFLLMDNFSNANVQVVRGENKKYEIHYWVEADNLIYDITAHQFNGVEFPIYGVKEHPLGSEYKETSRQFASVALFDNDFIDIERINSVLPVIKCLISKHA